MTNTASVKSSSASGTISAADPEVSIGTPLPLDVSVARVDAKSSADLELGHWYAANALAEALGPDGNVIGNHAAGFYHAYYDKAGTPRYTTTQLKSSLAPVAVYEVTIKAQAATYQDPATGTTWTNAQIAEALKDRSVYVDLAQNGNDSRAMFFALAMVGTTPTTEEKANVLPAAAGTTTMRVTGAAISLGGTASVLETEGAGIKCWFSMYVDGLKTSDVVANKDTGAVSGNFTVTVTDSVA